MAGAWPINAGAQCPMWAASVAAAAPLVQPPQRLSAGPLASAPHRRWPRRGLRQWPRRGGRLRGWRPLGQRGAAFGQSLPDLPQDILALARAALRVADVRELLAKHLHEHVL